MTEVDWPYKNFTKAEVACKCGCGMLPSKEAMERLQALRNAYGKSMKISSGARCPAHNVKESATESLTGPHTQGAFDILIDRTDAFELLKAAMNSGATGIGVSQKGLVRFLHVDWLQNAPGQPRPTIWSY